MRFGEISEISEIHHLEIFVYHLPNMNLFSQAHERGDSGDSGRFVEISEMHITASPFEAYADEPHGAAPGAARAAREHRVCATRAALLSATPQEH